jgi:hypothetical protein
MKIETQKSPETEFPTTWKKRFALFPTRVSHDGVRTVWVWLETYEVRTISRCEWEVVTQTRFQDHPETKWVYRPSM